MSEQQKGKYIEISKKHAELGEQVSWHAENGIGIQSGKSVKMHGAENGIVFGTNTPMPDKIKAGAKCVVLFRPHDTYQGEFGFDWLRAGDSGHKGDTWFGKIMGRYFEADNTTVFQDGNSWNNNFRIEKAQYNKKLSSYKSFAVPWKTKQGKPPYLYTIPRLTMLKGKKAKLSLKLDIQEKPDKLSFEFKNKDAEKFLQLSQKQLGDIRTGKYDKPNYLTISCLQEFDVEQTLYVKSDGVICGALSILPNSAQFRKNINVVFIQVMTDANGIAVTGGPASGGTDFFKQCLAQALVIPNLKIETNVLDCSSSLMGLYHPFRDQFCTVATSGAHAGKYVVTKDAGLRAYLENALSQKFGNKYAGYYTLFFIGEKADWNGFSYYNSTFGVYFKGHNKATLAHETFHAMGLAHTFNGIDATARYTYEATKTDNIMDYSHIANPPIDRKILYYWQWKLLNPKV